MVKPLIEFGNFSLSLAARVLRYYGVEVRLKPKEAELLALLAEHFPKIATTRAIMASLWPESATSDAALSQTVYRLRRALAAKDPSFRFVRTVPGVGYRLAVPSEIVHHAIPEFGHEAFALHRRAVFSLSDRSEDTLLVSIELFHEALRLEPAYVPSMIGLARGYANAGIRLIVDPFVAYQRARSLLERAAEISPNEPEIFALLSILELFFIGQSEQTHELAEKALVLDKRSDSAFAALAWDAIARRRFGDAFAYIDRALSKKPSSLDYNAILGYAMYAAGRYQGARQQLEQTLELRRSYAPGLFYLASLLTVCGDFGAAHAALDAIGGNDMTARVLAIRGIICAKTDNDVGLRRAIDQLEKLALPTQLSQAAIYLAMGRTDTAARLLEAAVANREPGLFFALVDPLYAAFDARAYPVTAKRLGVALSAARPKRSVCEVL